MPAYDGKELPKQLDSEYLDMVNGVVRKTDPAVLDAAKRISQGSVPEGYEDMGWKTPVKIDVPVEMYPVIKYKNLKRGQVYQITFQWWAKKHLISVDVTGQIPLSIERVYLEYAQRTLDALSKDKNYQIVGVDGLDMPESARAKVGDEINEYNPLANIMMQNQGNETESNSDNNPDDSPEDENDGEFEDLPFNVDASSDDGPEFVQADTEQAQGNQDSEQDLDNENNENEAFSNDEEEEQEQDNVDDNPEDENGDDQESEQDREQEFNQRDEQVPNSDIKQEANPNDDEPSIDRVSNQVTENTTEVSSHDDHVENLNTDSLSSYSGPHVDELDVSKVMTRLDSDQVFRILNGSFPVETKLKRNSQSSMRINAGLIDLVKDDVKNQINSDLGQGLLQELSRVDYVITMILIHFYQGGKVTKKTFQELCLSMALDQIRDRNLDALRDANSLNEIVNLDENNRVGLKIRWFLLLAVKPGIVKKINWVGSVTNSEVVVHNPHNSQDPVQKDLRTIIGLLAADMSQRYNRDELNEVLHGDKMKRGTKDVVDSEYELQKRIYTMRMTELDRRRLKGSHWRGR